MGRARLSGACVIALLAISLVGVASASAETLELGRCVKKSKAEGAGYSDSACNHAVTTGAKYEWVAGPGADPGFTMVEHHFFSSKHSSCAVALSELSLSAEERAAAETAAEPERAELLHSAGIHEQVADERLSRIKETPAKCESLLKTEQAKAPVELQTVKGTTVECGGVNARGEYTGGQAVGSLTMTLTECSAAGAACTSAGAGEGEILTSALAGTLGVIKAPEWAVPGEVGLDTFAAEAGEPIAEFSCDGTTVTVTGSVIRAVKQNKMQSTEKANFAETNGIQHPEGFEGLAPSVLATSIGGGAEEQAGLRLKARLTNDERIEVRSL